MNCSHIIVRTELSTGEGDLDVKIQLAEEAGKEVMHQYEGANPVPLDNMIVCVQMPKADDKNKTIGYWGQWKVVTKCRQLLVLLVGCGSRSLLTRVVAY